MPTAEHGLRTAEAERALELDPIRQVNVAIARGNGSMVMTVLGCADSDVSDVGTPGFRTAADSRCLPYLKLSKSLTPREDRG